MAGAKWIQGAILPLLWVGLVWGQPPEARSAGADQVSPRMITIQARGQKVRCQVMQSWTEPDGTTAYIVQAVDGGEKITVVKKATAGGQAGPNPSMQKVDLYYWGVANNPPSGAPQPPATPLVSVPATQPVALPGPSEDAAPAPPPANTPQTLPAVAPKDTPPAAAPKDTAPAAVPKDTAPAAVPKDPAPAAAPKDPAPAAERVKVVAKGPPVVPSGDVEVATADGLPSAGAGSSEQDDSRFWVGGGYLLWWVKKAPMPQPLVTTGSVNDFFPGAIGQPSTRVLFGGSDIDFGAFSGGRLNAGYWLDCEHTCAFEASGFLLETRAVHSEFASDANGNPVLTRPIFGINTGIGDREVNAEVAIPGDKFGKVDVTNTSRLWGAEANFLHECCCSPCGSPCSYRVVSLAGFRYLHLEEDLRIVDQFTQIPNPDFFGVNFNGGSVPPLSTLSRSDRFNTLNNFYGGQVGARVEYFQGRWFADVAGKVALGDTHEEVKISGSTTLLNGPQGPVTVPGGLLALRSNIGKHNHDAFSAVPEVELRVGYRLTDHIGVNVGYNFLYWTDVVRPGDQVNRNVDLTQVPTSGSFNPQGQAIQPTAVLKDADFWAQGLDFGLEFRY